MWQYLACGLLVAYAVYSLLKPYVGGKNGKQNNCDKNCGCS
jgi:hypothetical protein